MERVTFLKPFGAPQVPQFFFRRRRRRKLTPWVGHPWRPNFFFIIIFFSFMGAHGAQVSRRGARGTPTGVPRTPKGGAEGATPPEGGGNPAEGECFASFI